MALTDEASTTALELKLNVEPLIKAAKARDYKPEGTRAVIGGPKTITQSLAPGQTHSYKFDAVLEVAGGPARSPYDPQFNPKSINRIEAIGDDIRRQLDKLAKDGTRFVAK